MDITNNPNAIMILIRIWGGLRKGIPGGLRAHNRALYSIGHTRFPKIFFNNFSVKSLTKRTLLFWNESAFL